MTFRLSLLMLLAAGIFGVLLHREQQRGTFEPFDRQHREALWRLTGADRAPWREQAGEGRVLLARLDDVDRPPEQRVFDAWPPGPLEWQVILQNLKDWNPRAVALAPPVAPGRNPAPVTGGLVAAARGLPGLTAGVRASAEVPVPAVSPELPPGLPVLKRKGHIFDVPEFHQITPPSLPLQPGGIAEVDLGHRVTVKEDRCLVPMLARSGGRLTPTLALRALLAAAGIPAEEVVAEPGKAIRGPGGLEIPIDRAGNFRFYPPLAPEAEAVAADDFLFTRAQAEALYQADTPERAALRKVPGALLWMGLDNVASRRFTLPGGGSAPVSEAEITARALTALRGGRYLEPLQPVRQGFMQCCAIGFGLGMARGRKRNLWKGAAAGVVLLALTGLLAFHTHRLWVPSVPVLLQLLLAVVAGLLLPPAPAREKEV